MLCSTALFPGMRNALRIVALFLLISVTGYAQSPVALSYQFSMDTTNALLHVTLQCKGSQSGKTIIELPNEWAGQSGMYRAVQSLSVSGKNTVLANGEDSSHRVVTHKPNAALTIRYALKQDWEGELYYPNNFRGVIQSKYVQFTGYSLFVVPQLDPSAKVTAKLDWSAMPKNWTIANSLHAGSRKYKGTLFLGDFVNAVYTAGDFRLHKTQISGKPVFVAIRGNDWQFRDSMLVNRIEAILTMERKFWNDYSEPYYFVSLIPFAGNGSRNGTSLHQAFMLAMTTEVPVDADLDWLLTHEYFHRWNGTMIHLTEAIEQENSWFTEGFTEYYSYKLLHEAGILSFDDYVAKTNSMIAAYYLSPVRNDDKATLGANYWGSRDYQQIPYKKGFVYALYIDHLIRSSSANKYSLDNVFFDLRKLQSDGKQLTDTNFVELVKTYSGQDISELQQRYINKGETIPVVAGSVTKTELAAVSLGPYDAGFDVNASWEGKTITGVRTDSEAWKAGLRDGQTVKGYSIYRDDLSHPSEITVEENGETKTVSFIPMSVERTEVPQFSVKMH